MRAEWADAQAMISEDGTASLRRFSLLRGGAQHPPGLLWLPRPEAAGATIFARKVARRGCGL